MSALQRETVRVLMLQAKPRLPFFSNMIAAELFDAQHKRGPFELLPYVDGGYIVFDTGAPNGQGSRGRYGTLEEAHAALERIAAAEGCLEEGKDQNACRGPAMTDFVNCKSCERQILFAWTGQGKRMPLDAQPIITGTFFVFPPDRPDKPLECEHHTSMSPRADAARRGGRPRFVPHWATCPNAASHRQQPKAPRA